MAWPLRYPWRKPYGAWLLTTGGLLAIGLTGAALVSRLWGLSLPPYTVETIAAVALLVGLIAGLIVAQMQKPPEPGGLDDPDW